MSQSMIQTSMIGNDVAVNGEAQEDLIEDDDVDPINELIENDLQKDIPPVCLNQSDGEGVRDHASLLCKYISNVKKYTKKHISK